MYGEGIELFNDDLDKLLDELKAKNHSTEEIPLLHEFIMTARPGLGFRYFTGYHLDSSILSREMRKITYGFAVKGVIYLLQRRFKIDPNMFEYLAIKASIPPSKWLLPWDEERIGSVWKRRLVREQESSQGERVQ